MAAVLSAASNDARLSLPSALLCCAACGGSLDAAVLLPCVHSLCGLCFDQLPPAAADGGGFSSNSSSSGAVGNSGKPKQVECPSCRCVGAARPNTFLAATGGCDAPALPMPQLLCDTCKDSNVPVTCRCTECNKVMCAGCRRWHDKFNKTHAVAVLAAGDATGSGSADGQNKTAPVAAPLVPPTCASTAAHGDSSSSSSLNAAAAPLCDSFCSTCGLPLCAVCRRTCERDGHDVTAATAASTFSQGGNDDLGLVAEKIAHLARQSLAASLGTLSSALAGLAEERALLSSSAGGRPTDTSGGGSAALAVASAEALKADLRRLEANESAVISAVRQAFERARHAVERDHAADQTATQSRAAVGAISSSSSVGTASARRQNLEERIGLLIAYGRALAASGGASDVLDQQPVVIARARMLLAQVELEMAVVAAVETGGRDETLACSHVAAMDSSVELAADVAGHTLRHWTGMLHPAAGDQHALPAADDRFVQPVQAELHSRQPLVRAAAASAGPCPSTAELAEHVFVVRLAENVSEAPIDGPIAVMTAADNAAIAGVRMATDAAAVVSGSTALRAAVAVTAAATTAAAAGPVQSSHSPVAAVSSNSEAVTAAEAEVSVDAFDSIHQQNTPVSQANDPVAAEMEASSGRQSLESVCSVRTAATDPVGSIAYSAAASATANSSSDRFAAAGDGHVPAGGPAADGSSGSDDTESRPLLLRTASTDDWAMLTCCYCRGVLDEPVLLACLHSCCSRCLGDINTTDWHLQAAAAGQQSVTCARCHATTVLPVAGDGVPDAKLNGFAAARLRAMHIAAGLAKCDLCIQAGSGRSMSQQTTVARDATYQCTDCAKFLCDDCLRWHRRFNGGRHRVEQIAAAAATAAAATAGQPAEPSSSVVYAVQCETHGSKRDLYCTVCERLKCIECAKLPCMEVRHEIIVADKDGAAELLRNVVNEVRDKCGELALWLAAEREEVVLSDEASAAAVDVDDSMTASGEGIRQEGPGLSPTELVTKALERSTEDVRAAYSLLGERSVESSKRAVVLTQEARRAVAYCSAVLACSPLVVTDHLPVVKQRLNRLLAEVEARLAVTPDSVEPSIFSLVERQGEPKKALVMAASASASAGGQNSSARPDVHGSKSGSSTSGVNSGVGADSQADSRGADDDPANMAAVSLKCALCSKDPADEPLLLACLHGSCCRRCVGFTPFARGEAEPRGVKCTECGHVTDAKSLRSSSVAVALSRAAPVVEEAGETGFSACQICLDAYRRVAARSLCADCGIFLCQTCRRHHDKFNHCHKMVTADATVESRRQATEIVASVVIFCPEDFEKYDMYCRTCDRLRCCICAKRCLADEHSVSSDPDDLSAIRHDETSLHSLGNRLQSGAALLAERANAAADGLRSGHALKADLELLRSGERRLAASLAGRAVTLAAAVRAPAADARQRRQLRERVRHANHYSRSLLAFAEASAAAACCLLEQHADVLRCIRQLLDEVRAVQGASISTLAAATNLGVAAGSSSPSLHVGSWEDVVAQYQRAIGIVRDGVDNILSEPKAEAVAAVESAASAAVDLTNKADSLTEAGSSIGSDASVNSDGSATSRNGRVESAISGGSGSSSSSNSSNASSDRVSAGSRSGAAKPNPSGRNHGGGRSGGDSAMLFIENAIINDIQDDDDGDSPSDGESLTLVTDAEAAEAGIISCSSFETSKEARDLAITSDGRVLVAVLWGGIVEYACASGQRLSNWKPPQFDEGADCASSVDILEDDIVVVGLIGSQSVALLRRLPREDGAAKAGVDRGDSDAEDEASDSPWEVESNYALPVAPWCVSSRSGVLAAIGAVEVATDSGRSWRSGPYLCLTRRADGHTLLTHTLAYSAESVALTGLNSVVVLSSDEHPLDGGRRLAHVAEAFDFDGVPLWYTESGGAGDVCASPSGNTLYLALPNEHRVRAIAAADGRSEGDALSRHDPGLRKPVRVAMVSAGEGASNSSSFASVAVLTAGDEIRKVVIYPARMSHGDL